MRNPLQQAFDAAPALKRGGLNEVKYFQTLYVSEQIQTLMTTPSDVDIIKIVRRLQGISEFLAYLDTVVQQDED